MISILDANAAIELVDRKTYSSAIHKQIQSSESIIVPDLYVYELANAYWKYHQFEKIDEEICSKSLLAAISLPDDFVSFLKSGVDILSFSCATGLSAYDSSYAILTKNMGGTLITLDKRLAETCKRFHIAVFNPKLK